MKYQIEMKRVENAEWRQYTIHSTYIGAWISAIYGRTLANFRSWLNNAKSRIETRIVVIDDNFDFENQYNFN